MNRPAVSGRLLASLTTLISPRRAAWQLLSTQALALALLCIPTYLIAQSAAPGSQAPVSLADALRHANNKEIHIFYIHGIGSDGPGDYDSWALRKSICDYLKDCSAPAGIAVGEWDYADQGEFQLNAPPPSLEYMGERAWKTSEEWNAAAPYAIHFQLIHPGGTIYVDELNWWPPIFSLKCRQIVANDAHLVGPSTKRIQTCSKREDNKGVPGRFKSYDWIPTDQASQLLALPSKGAFANRGLKNGLLDWGFSDAMMALGPLRSYLVDGIRQLLLKSIADSLEPAPEATTRPRSNQEFIIVSHSLGSYLIFAALDDPQAATGTASVGQSADPFAQILARTSLVYFFANQLRLLELASLDGTDSKNLVKHFEVWGRIHCDYLKSLPGASECTRPRIVALNDPSDLLTWTVPTLATVDVRNYTVRNATHWFWIFENPVKAHDNYASDRKAIKRMLEPVEH